MSPTNERVQVLADAVTAWMHARPKHFDFFMSAVLQEPDEAARYAAVLDIVVTRLHRSPEDAAILMTVLKEGRRAFEKSLESLLPDVPRTPPPADDDCPF